MGAATILDRRVDGFKVHAVRTGSGPLKIVLLHGFGGSPLSYTQIAEAVEATGAATLYSVGIPGFARSQRLKGRVAAKGLVEHLAQVIRTLAPGDQVILIGHSFGGGMAIALGTMHPELVKGLVLLNPLTTPRPIGIHILNSVLQSLFECRNHPDMLVAGISDLTSTFLPPNAPTIECSPRSTLRWAKYLLANSNPVGATREGREWANQLWGLRDLAVTATKLDVRQCATQLNELDEPLWLLQSELDLLTRMEDSLACIQGVTQANVRTYGLGHFAGAYLTPEIATDLIEAIYAIAADNFIAKGHQRVHWDESGNVLVDSGRQLEPCSAISHVLAAG